MAIDLLPSGSANIDPVESNPDFYHTLFENDRVRVIEYLDRPGDHTTPHHHPDSVMVTLSAFRRIIASSGRQVEVDLPANAARWLPAQHHSGENIGDTETHTIFVELKEPAPPSGAIPDDAELPPLGPDSRG